MLLYFSMKKVAKGSSGALIRAPVRTLIFWNKSRIDFTRMPPNHSYKYNIHATLMKMCNVYVWIILLVTNNPRNFKILNLQSFFLWKNKLLYKKKKYFENKFVVHLYTGKLLNLFEIRHLIIFVMIHIKWKVKVIRIS